MLVPSITIVRTLSETSNDNAICCMLNHGNTLVQLLHRLLYSSCLPESTLPPAAQLHLLQYQQGDLVGHHLRLSNILERISLPSNEPLTRQTLPTVDRKHFLTTILCIESFCPKKIRTKERCFSVVHFSSMVTILVIETSMWTCAWRGYYLDYYEAGLCCYLVIHIENLLHPLQLFYFLCDLFTGSPSYFTDIVTWKRQVSRWFKQWIYEV
jgi:hypothetical protein